MPSSQSVVATAEHVTHAFDSVLNHLSSGQQPLPNPSFDDVCWWEWDSCVEVQEIQDSKRFLGRSHRPTVSFFAVLSLSLGTRLQSTAISDSGGALAPLRPIICIIPWKNMPWLGERDFGFFNEQLFWKGSRKNNCYCSFMHFDNSSWSHTLFSRWTL